MTHSAGIPEKDYQRLQESEQRFRALIIATSDVVYKMSPDWKVMKALESKGLLSDINKPLDNWMEKYIPSTDHQVVLSAIHHAIENKTTFELEHRVLHADESIGWAFSRAIPVLNNNGEIIEWFGVANDITRKKQVETALAKTREDLESSKRLYEAITSSTPDLVYVFDLNYRFLYANKALLTMWGTTEEEARGKGLLELGYEPWHAEMHEREIDRVQATKQMIRGEVSFPHATQGKRLYDYIFAPVFNDAGNVVAIAGTTRDISDLKAAEDALKQSEEEFRTLTQSLPQLIFTTKPNGAADFFNEQWYLYTGSTPDQSFGEGWLNSVHENHRREFRLQWRQSLETGAPMMLEFQLKSKQNTYNWFYVLGNAIKGEDGNIRKWVCTLTNIEEQKAVEENLEQLVEERTKELQRSNSDLLQFAHVASHDLKEPLRKVKTFAKFLENELGKNLSDKAILYLDKISSATLRMDNMIEGVLNYSTLSNIENTFEEVNLNNIIANIENDLEILIEQKKATVKAEELPAVTGSPLLLYQLFYNLINNSLKFSKEDIQPVISISCNEINKAGKEAVEIRVRDNGIGFNNDEAEAIFDTFTRLHPKGKYEGTGLGLALCKKIVERHKGTIYATGNEDEYAEFIIDLPV